MWRLACWSFGVNLGKGETLFIFSLLSCTILFYLLSWIFLVQLYSRFTYSDRTGRTRARRWL